MRYEGLSAGSHRFELRNLADSVFVDSFCVTATVPPQTFTSGSSSGGTTQSSFTGSPTTGPGQSTSNDSSINAGQESKSNVSLGTNARALSIVAETSGNLPVKLALVSPTGLTLQIVDAVNGVAVLTTPVTTGGIYTVKVINVNLGPVQVWTVATNSCQVAHGRGSPRPAYWRQGADLVSAPFFLPVCLAASTLDGSARLSAKGAKYKSAGYRPRK